MELFIPGTDKSLLETHQQVQRNTIQSPIQIPLIDNFLQYFRATSNLQTSLLLQPFANYYNLPRSHLLRRIKNRIESDPRNDNAELFYLYPASGNQIEDGFLLFGLSESIEAYSWSYERN